MGGIVPLTGVFNVNVMLSVTSAMFTDFVG